MTILGEGHTVFSQLHQVHQELPSPRGGGSRLRGGGGQRGGPGPWDRSSFTHRLDRRRRLVDGAGGGCISLEVEENSIDVTRLMGFDPPAAVTDTLSPFQSFTHVNPRDANSSGVKKKKGDKDAPHPHLG